MIAGLLLLACSETFSANRGPDGQCFVYSGGSVAEDDPDCPCRQMVRVLTGTNIAGVTCREDQTLTIDPVDSVTSQLQQLGQTMSDLDVGDIPVAIARCNCKGTP